jgi:hypothetical protein
MQGGSRNLDLSKKFEIFNKKILDWVIQYNSNCNATGEESPFPLLATCQGIELLYALLYKDTSVLDKFDSWNLFIPMHPNQNILNKNNFKTFKTFSNFTDLDFEILISQPSTVHLHNYGIRRDIDSHKKMAEEYQGIVNLEILTSAWDRNGKEFIGSVEERKLNIFGSIFHPEQMPYNYCLSIHENLYCTESYSVNSKLEKAFVDLCLKNKNKIQQEELDKLGVIKNSSRLNYIKCKTSEKDYEYDFLIFKDQNNK